MILPTLPKDWIYLQPILQTPEFKKLWDRVEVAYENSECFPPKDQIFHAFEACKSFDLKVVILGQDPYHGMGEAHGLSFSVPDGVKIPPSLMNIFKEIQQNYQQIFLPTSGNLSRWAQQGVLLLNATLTVEKDQANSHQHFGWQAITDAILKEISTHHQHIVFMLWGAFAQKKAKFIDTSKHLVLTSGHPSPLSANQGKWFGNRHFILANEFLSLHQNCMIEW
ncbi:MAG: uracil-DNA glycosylase [Flavobacteriales bacterium]|nr:uracil-DNA glycosylase [Flavobacteriales bacterium]